MIKNSLQIQVQNATVHKVIHVQLFLSLITGLQTKSIMVLLEESQLPS